jgi:hypothetical protein
MKAEAALNFTLRRLFFGDMLLNWCLGAALTFFPAATDHLIGTSPVAAPVFYTVIGVLFLLFAAWQTTVIARRRMGPPALIFAAVMAEGPVVLLTAALLFIDLPLRPGWRAALWAGNVYMLFLGVWYLFVAWLIARRAA